MKRYSMGVIGASALALLAVTSLGAGATQAQNYASSENRGADKTVTLSANLSELNGSGASGTATAVVRNQKILQMDVQASGLTPDAPHAQHIHFGAQALHECPTLAQDSNGDGRLTTAEGVPAYGPVVVSLTTTGDTTPASFLDVTRFPVAKNGTIDYSRDNIGFTDVAGTGFAGADGTAKQIADAIRAGEGVVVIHGIDYDGDGAYSNSRGASELDPTLPAEATDPAVCGILH
ncbi:MAG: hypothetical protein ABIW36_11680 [Terrimesophilobacter sp.]